MGLEVSVEIVVKLFTVTSINEMKQKQRRNFETKFHRGGSKIKKLCFVLQEHDRWRIAFVQPPIFEPLLVFFGSR